MTALTLKAFLVWRDPLSPASERILLMPNESVVVVEECPAVHLWVFLPVFQVQSFVWVDLLV